MRRGVRYIMEEKKMQVVHLQMVRDDPRETARLVQMRPTYVQVVSIGAIDYCTAPIPELFKAALLSNVPNILSSHNHPSGDCTCSQEDILLTEKVLQAG